MRNPIFASLMGRYVWINARINRVFTFALPTFTASKKIVSVLPTRGVWNVDHAGLDASISILNGAFPQEATASAISLDSLLEIDSCQLNAKYSNILKNIYGKSRREQVGLDDRKLGKTMSA